MSKNPYGNPSTPSIWAKDGLKRFAVTFRSSSRSDSACDYPLAKTAQEAKDIIVERYGHSILIDNVAEAA